MNESLRHLSRLESATRVKVLLVAAKPVDMLPLGLDEEGRLMKEGLNKAQSRDMLEVEEGWSVRVDDLQTLLTRHKPNAEFCLLTVTGYWT